MPPNTLRFCQQIIPRQPRNFKIVEVKVFNTRLRLVVRVRLGFSCRRSMLLGGGITKDSPEHGRTVLVDIYRLRCLVAYGGVLWCPRMVPHSERRYFTMHGNGIGCKVQRCLYNLRSHRSIYPRLTSYHTYFRQTNQSPILRYGTTRRIQASV